MIDGRFLCFEFSQQPRHRFAYQWLDNLKKNMPFDPNILCGSTVMSIFTDHDQSESYSAKPCPSKKVVMHASGYTMLTCIRMQNVIKIYHVVQEL